MTHLNLIPLSCQTTVFSLLMARRQPSFEIHSGRSIIIQTDWFLRHSWTHHRHLSCQSCWLPQPLRRFDWWLSPVTGANQYHRWCQMKTIKMPQYRPGPDKILNRILKSLTDTAFEALANLFTASLFLGFVLRDWKHAHFLSFPNWATLPSNYCTISLTPCNFQAFRNNRSRQDTS